MQSSREARGARAGDRGGALVLVLIGIVLAASLVALSTTSSVGAARSAGSDLDAIRAWYAAHAGLWVAADAVNGGGSGDIDGDVDSVAVVPSGAVDGDADGFADFSPVAALLARGEGAFEARCRDEGGGRWRVRARGVGGAVTKVLEAVFEPQAQGPFRWAAFGVSSAGLTGSETSDSWNSDAASWGTTPVTTTVGAQQIRSQSGGIATDGGATIGGNASVFGDAEAVGTVVISGSGSVSGSVGVLSPPLAPVAPTWTVPGPGDPSVNNAAIGLAYDAPLTRSSGVLVLPPGRYVFSALALSGSARLIVDTSAGDVEIFITQASASSMSLSSTAQLLPSDPSKAVGGSVIVRTEGGLQVGSSARLNVSIVAGEPVPGDPIKVQVYSTATPSGPTPEVSLGGSSRTSAVIYAPGARLRYGSNADVWGSCVTDTVQSSGNSRLHFDEALRTFVPASGGTTILVPVLIVGR